MPSLTFHAARLFRAACKPRYAMGLAKLWLQNSGLRINQEQSDTFRQLNLNRDKAVELAEDVCQKVLGKPYDEQDGMMSEHIVIFASLAAEKRPIKSILEIGTFDGQTALILATLFPDAKILTIDLQDDSNEFTNMYNRQDCSGQFTEQRNKTLSKSPNIEFQDMNSLNLCRFDDARFDLVWVDGAHGYPVVAVDIANALRLSGKNGLILVDDVHTQLNNSDAIYSSTAAHEVLTEFRHVGLFSDVAYFRKRLNIRNNVPRKTEKFVALAKPRVIHEASHVSS